MTLKYQMTTKSTQIFHFKALKMSTKIGIFGMQICTPSGDPARANFALILCIQIFCKHFHICFPQTRTTRLINNGPGKSG
jgi:hypothetical protein